MIGIGNEDLSSATSLNLLSLFKPLTRITHIPSILSDNLAHPFAVKLEELGLNQEVTSMFQLQGTLEILF